MKVAVRIVSTEIPLFCIFVSMLCFFCFLACAADVTDVVDDDVTSLGEGNALTNSSTSRSANSNLVTTFYFSCF